MIYFCCDEQRRNIVAQQTVFNGIDFLEVVDQPADPIQLRQRTIQLHFIHPVAPGFLRIENFRIEGGERVRNIAVTSVDTDALASPPGSPPKQVPGNVVTIRLAESGDFSTYTLRLVRDQQSDDPPSQFDPILSAVDFSFKVACPSDFDCAPESTCGAEVVSEPDINYLAKDYSSFRQLMLDRMATLVPDWAEGKDRNPADLGVVLVELLAYVGDYLSYQQDAVATESYIGTARRRASVRRHARLVDYQMSDGSNARAWVRVVAGDGVDGTLLKQSHNGHPTEVLTRVSDDLTVMNFDSPDYENIRRGRPEVFELMHDISLYAAHNVLRFYTWDALECCLPKGATRATLQGHFPDLNAGDVLILAEVRGSKTGEAEDADAARRHPVRLTGVKLSFDPLHSAMAPMASPPNGLPVTEIQWHEDDALPFPLCVSSRSGTVQYADVSVAWGNVVLVDHGLTIDDTPEDKAINPYTTPASLAPDYVPRPNPALVLRGQAGTDGCEGRSHCREQQRILIPPRYRPRLALAPLTQAVPYDATQPPVSASAAMRWTLREPRPVIKLTSFGPSTAATFNDLTITSVWTPVRDLLSSRGGDRHFVVEVETNGSAYLRFGDGQFGMRPNADDRFLARYRLGNGLRGNVGASAIAHLATADPAITDQVVIGVGNPIAARGGVDAETIEEARRNAPSGFRIQQRAVTADDYASAALRCGTGLQRAAATFRWTGSWQTVFVSADRLGGKEVDAEFEADLRSRLEPFRMAGHDLEVDDAQFVPLEIGMNVCVKANYFASDVKAALLEVFSNRVLPDGRRGVFHPDNLSFGQPVFSSRLYAAAQAVTGVDSVEITRFQRQGIDSDEALKSGSLEMARLEIARLDNNPDFPERGLLKFAMRGGR